MERKFFPPFLSALAIRDPFQFTEPTIHHANNVDDDTELMTTKGVTVTGISSDKRMGIYGPYR